MKLKFDYSLLRGKMREKNVSIATLAYNIGMSESHLCQKLTNHYPFKQTDIIRICDFLQIPHSKIPTYFFVLAV